MESKQAEKSRKEKRKEARSEKHQSRHLSWIEHQKVSKLKRNATKSKQKPKTSNNNTSKASGKELLEKKREVLNVIEKDEKDVAEEKSSKKLRAALPLDSTETLRKEKKSLKRKSKSKFDEYLEMEMNKGTVTAEEDLAWERKLAKKLKVKSGKLRGTDDGINTLFNGIASVLDYPVDEGDETEFKISSKTKKRKKRKVAVVAEKEEEENEDELEGGLAAEESEQVESGAAEVTWEEPPVKKPALAKTVKYVPPHLRSRGENESQEHIQIRRQVRGLLNRLSESNLESITGEISTIYRSIGRIVGSQIISEEVLASCTGGPRGNEQYAAVFAAFVAGMACLVGIDFSAKVIASLARSFEDEYSKKDNLSLRNLTLLLSYLCFFGVSSSDLIYDFLMVLSKRLTEIDVSTILTILQCCGMKLRSDDPTAMKDFILNVQSRVNELKSSFGSVAGNRQNINNKRMEFMLETICEIKNNKKRSKEDPSQHTRIKKWLQKLRVEDVLLRGLKWSKLLDPIKKGQWWISGDVASATYDVKEVACTIDREVLEAQKLLQLAAAQRMNTDARRAIFCIIMSGEDYVDAFEKLLRLDLPGKQDREIVRVLVECCLQEKIFNKYYTVLASKLCSHDKNHKFTLQYCLWDHFKELESMELIRSMNLARFIAEMLVSFSLSLAVLKTLELSDPLQLTTKRIMHFRMLFEAIFEHPDAIVWNIFTRVAVILELETLREGLEFFIKQYVVNTNKKMSAKFKVAKKALNNTAGVLM